MASRLQLASTARRHLLQDAYQPTRLDREQPVEAPHLDDEDAAKELLYGRIDALHAAERLRVNINLEARHELNEMRSLERSFDAVGYYKAYADNAFQVQARLADRHGRLARRHSQAYRKREKQIAIDTLAKSSLVPADLIEFLKAQCRWWSAAQQRGPSNLADEWKRQIRATEDMFRAATGAKFSEVTDAVGHATGHFEPTLEVIFPSWIKEQRRLAIRSMEPWVKETLGVAPAPFALAAGDLDQFCDWLEAKGLYQFYWHYRRLVDGGWHDGPIERAASTAEVAGFANLVEMIANAALVDKGKQPRGETLGTKLKMLFGPGCSVDFHARFKKHAMLMQTKKQTLRQRLGQISRLKRTAGAHTPILRTLLALVAVRNEGSHLGLLSYDRVEVTDLIRILSLASLIIWRAK